VYPLPIDPDVQADDVVATSARRPRLPHFSLDVVLAVFIGGVLGGLARYAIERAAATPKHGFPWDVLVVNAAGAFVLALLVVLVVEVLPPNRYLRPGLGTGFLGAFTTFSSLAVGADQLVSHDRGGLAAAYLLASVFAGLAAAAMGMLAGRRIATQGQR
jgi:CrcB protein